jgi:hypothetical protein
MSLNETWQKGPLKTVGAGTEREHQLLAYADGNVSVSPGDNTNTIKRNEGNVRR